MATNANPNTFSLTGFVAVDANVRSFDKSAVARFPMSVSRRENKGQETIRKSALINCEVWSANAESKRFALLKKGSLVVINGYIKPEEFTDRNGQKQQRITFVCTSVAKPSTDKATKSAEPVAVAEAVTEEVPF